MTAPQKQTARSMSFEIQKEVDAQLKVMIMQATGVIESLNSPWASSSLEPSGFALIMVS